MKRSVLIVLFLTACLVWACNQTSKEEKPAGENVLEGEILRQRFGSCDTVVNKGATVDVTLWRPSGTSELATAVKNTLNSKSVDIINSFADSSSVRKNPAASHSIDGAFEVFEGNYTAFKRDVPSAPGCWEIGIEGDSVMSTPKVLFYQLNHFAFTGGAHPNSFRAFYAFDQKTGKELEIKSFVKDTAALTILVEKHFRKLEKLTPGADLEKSGYFLLNHRFALPVNYVFTREGLLFYYNAYEIAPYARGVIKFVIPYTELDGIVKTEEVF
jgi:hypothetical protein